MPSRDEMRARKVTLLAISVISEEKSHEFRGENAITAIARRISDCTLCASAH